MKNVWALSIAVCAMLVQGGLAEAGRNNTGCGLGTIAFEGKDGLISQVFAATTNGTFGNQTFGITSGTLECERAATLVASEKLNTFVGENMDNLAMDISKGSGEYLTTLAVLLDVPIEERPVFYTLLQSNFASIYPTEGVTHTDVLKNLETVLSSS